MDNNTGRVIDTLYINRLGSTLEVELHKVRSTIAPYLIVVCMPGLSKATTIECRNQYEAEILYTNVCNKYKDILWGIDRSIQEALTREVDRLVEVGR